MQYLRNAQSDFDPVFSYLFVFSSSVTYAKTEKMVFTPPPLWPLKVVLNFNINQSSNSEFNCLFTELIYQMIVFSKTQITEAR